MDEAVAAEVVVEVHDGVAVLRLPGPALTAAVRSGLLARLRAVADDARVRVVVLTGTGSVFCAGQDLAEHAAAVAADPHRAFDGLDEHYGPIVSTLLDLPQPVLAAVNGLCAGGGLGLALACDLRMAAATARFSAAFAHIGLVPDCGVSLLLPAAVGQARAAEIVLAAEPFTADDALRWGLLGEVVEPDRLAERAAAKAAALARMDPVALAESKRLLHGRLRGELAAALRRESQTQRRLGARPEHADLVAGLAQRLRHGHTRRT